MGKMPGAEEVNEALGLLLHRHDMVYDVVARVPGRNFGQWSFQGPDIGWPRRFGSTPWLHLRSRCRSFRMEPQELFNDLKAAIEVNLGEGWQILYPENGLKFEISDLLVEVRLRDDPGICGKQVLGPQAMISQAFEDFSGRVARFLENEEVSVARERGRRQELEKLYLKQIKWKNNWLILKGMVTMVGFCFCCFVVIGLDFSDVLVSLGIVAVAVIATVIAVLASLALWYAFSYMVAVIMWDQTWRDIKHGPHDGSKILLSRALLAPFLCQFNLMTSGRYFLALGSMVPCVMAAVIVSEILAESGYTWPIILIWSIPCCFCVCFFYVRCACREPLSTKEYLSEIRERTAHNTLTFKGNVIPDRSKACVCSWPGKYESAWQTLVDRSHDGQISAAVVFLPKGSPNFGRHDPIPSSEALWGDCWCFPLYGEQKPWGCRWWTLYGRPTLKRQFVVVSNYRSSFLKIWRAKAKSKVLPLLEQSIARENVFGRKRKSSKSRSPTAKR